MKFSISTLAIFCAFNIFAAAPSATVTNVVRTVLVNTNAHLIFPTNFWLSNFTAGSGISFAGTTNITISAAGGSTFQNATVSNVLNVSNITSLGGVFTNGFTNLGNAVLSNSTGLRLTVTNNLNADYATASRAAIFDAAKNLTNSTVTATELGYVSGVSSALQTQIDAKFPTASTNILMDTNTFRQFTNLVTFNQYTNALTNGSGLLTLDFTNAAADNVFFAPSASFTLHLTNLPQALPAGKSITLKLRGTNLNVTVTMPATLTNRFGGVHAATYILPANQHARMGFDFPGNSAANTFTNGSYYWITNAP